MQIFVQNMEAEQETALLNGKIVFGQVIEISGNYYRRKRIKLDQKRVLIPINF